MVDADRPGASPAFAGAGSCRRGPPALPPRYAAYPVTPSPTSGHSSLRSRPSFFHPSSFERGREGSTYPSKPRVRRHIVEHDLTRVPDRTDCKKSAALNGDEHGITRLRNPRSDNLRGLIGEPPP